MKTRIIVAAIFIPILLVVLLVLPPVFLMGVIMLISACCAFELLRAAGGIKYLMLYVYALVAALAIPLVTYFNVAGIYYQLILYALAVILFAEAVISYGVENPVTFRNILTVLFAGFLIPCALTCLLKLKMMDNGKYLVLIPFICTIVSDSGAYFVGVFFGKHKGILQVSPKKSLEGFIGSLVSLIIGMLIYGLILKFAIKLDVNFGILMLYALVGNIATQLGDLAFSLIKRERRIKDYGNLIPGHGGMMDRFDSMVFAAPVIYILVTLVPAF